MFSEAARHQLRDKAHATQSNRSLHYTAYTVRFAARLGICFTHRLTWHYYGARKLAYEVASGREGLSLYPGW
jgi:hypothetical protein